MTLAQILLRRPSKAIRWDQEPLNSSPPAMGEKGDLLNRQEEGPISREQHISYFRHMIGPRR